MSEGPDYSRVFGQPPKLPGVRAIPRIEAAPRIQLHGVARDLRAAGPGQNARTQRLLAHPGLIALCVGVNLLEAGLLALLGPRSALSLAPQASTVVPLGVFHDLRWLIAYSDSWSNVVVKGLALLAGRSLITAVSVRAAWPGGAPRPGFGRCWLRAVVFTLFAGVLLAPMAVLLFGLAVAPVSWFWFAAVPSALILAMLFHHGAVAPGWWRQGMSARAVGWVLVAFLVASASGAVIAAVPVALGVLVAGAAGLANAWAWTGLVRSVLVLESRTGLRPVAPAALIGFAGIVVGGTVIGFAVVAPPHTSPQTPSAQPTATAAPAESAGSAGAQSLAVLVVAGYGTSWDGRSSPGLPGPYLESRFSYRGLGPNGSPLPYASASTNQPLVKLERLMAAQVGALHRTTGKPVAIVAESEGSLVAKAYLDASPGAPVPYLIMTSPLVAPGRVSYPPLGTRGDGLAGGEGLAVISAAIRSVAPIPLSPTSPFLRSVVDESRSLGPLLSCPLPGVSQAAILPLADAVGSPSGYDTGLIPTLVLPAFHGGMLTNRRADIAIASVLSAKALATSAMWSAADSALRSAASAWQSPSMGGVIYPDGLSCGRIRSALAAQLASHPPNPKAKFVIG